MLMRVLAVLGLLARERGDEALAARIPPAMQKARRLEPPRGGSPWT